MERTRPSEHGAGAVSELSYAVTIRAISAAVLLLSLVSLPLFSHVPVHAQANSGAAGDGPSAPFIGPDQDREFEKRAQSIETQLICPICPGETLDQSFVQISQDMKRIIREKLLEGEDEGQIKDFFVARYGTSVLAAPPRSGFNLVTWVVPPIGIAVGAVVLFFVMRQMRRGGPEPVAAGVGGPLAEDELADYLDEVDRDLSLGDSTSSGDEPSPRTDERSAEH